ncbi:MAG: beta-ketoacyl synthase N-terminal-like domain-containing protein [Nitrospirota bacterium]
MNPVAVTGMVKINSKDMDSIISNLNEHIREMRFIHDLEKLAIVGVGLLLSDADIHFPVGSTDISLYIGIDNAIEGIKDEYFNSVITYGILGSSPLLFPFTSPNALTARISIAFDIRGESITIPVKYSCDDVIEYAIECITGRYSRMAIAGGIMSSGLRNKGLRAEFSLLEDMKRAKERVACVYQHIDAMDNPNNRE